MKVSNLLRLAVVSVLLLPMSQQASAEIYTPPTQDACGNYAAKAVYQFRAQRAARCGFSGPRWSEDGAGQHHWCRTVRPAVTEGETKARATQLMRCLNQGSSININDMHLRTEVLGYELVSAARRGAMERMQQLIAAGADFANKQNGLMMNAINANNTRMVAFLRRLGTPLTQVGHNPLAQLMNYRSHHSGQDYVMMEYLLKQGVNPNLPDSDGYTPLKDAVSHDDHKAITILLRYRANPNLDIRGGACKTVMPLDLAIDKGNQQVIQLLRRAGARSQAQCSG